MRVVEETLPRVFLLENVEGLAFAGKDEGLRLLKDQIIGINKRTKSNYSPVVQVVSAAEHGVPQLRERVPYELHLETQAREMQRKGVGVSPTVE